MAEYLQASFKYHHRVKVLGGDARFLAASFSKKPAESCKNCNECDTRGSAFIATFDMSVITCAHLADVYVNAI